MTTPDASLLTIINVTAFILTLCAFVALLIQRKDITDMGRALIVAVGALCLAAFSGLTRRVSFDYATEVVILAYACAISASLWVLIYLRRSK